MTTVGQLQVDVALELPKVKYNWEDTDTNIRLVEEIRTFIDGMQLDEPVIPTAKHIAEVAIACKEHLQMRDFFMGVRSEKPSPNVATYLTLLNEVLDKEYAVPFATVLSSYLYEFDMPQEARETIAKVFETDPEYALAQLLNQVYEAGWDSSIMRMMAEDLHGAVLERIYDKETYDNHVDSAS